MKPADRLLELLDEPIVQLDRVGALIGHSIQTGAARTSIVTLGQGEDWVVGKIDLLAGGLTPGSTPREVIAHVFGTLGFRGNTKDYYDLDNSRLQHVLEHRTGIPLTLAIVAMEVGRRVGAQLLPIGMPGHFLLAEGPQASGRYFDPFSGGRELDPDGCRELFEQLVSGQSFDSAMLEPIGPTSVAARLLQNLRVVHLRRGDVSGLADVLALRVELPTSTPKEREEFSNILGALGRYDLAAEQRDLLALLQPDRAELHHRAAQRHRARRN